MAATVHPESRTVLGWLHGGGAVPRPGHPDELLVGAAALARSLDDKRSGRLSA